MRASLLPVRAGARRPAPAVRCGASPTRRPRPAPRVESRAASASATASSSPTSARDGDGRGADRSEPGTPAATTTTTTTRESAALAAQREAAARGELFGSRGAFSAPRDAVARPGLSAAAAALGSTHVDGFVRGGFVINGRVVLGPVILTRDAAFAWHVSGVAAAELTAAHLGLFSVVAPPVELILVGTGAGTVRNRDLQREMRAVAPVEFLDTGRAAATFNTLVEDGRSVGVALLPR